MNKGSIKSCSINSLTQELARFQVTASRLHPTFQLHQMLSEVTDCRVVKENNRRRVFCLQTSHGGYFLKLSSLTRMKDRVRHFFLCRRRWAEWRNLHRLQSAQIPAAKPLAIGTSITQHPKAFFLLTEQVNGRHLRLDSLHDARRVGEFATFLHSQGVYHADLNRKNIILTSEGLPSLIDVQKVYFLPWIPRWLRVHNLGRILFSFCSLDYPNHWASEFIEGYHQDFAKRLIVSEIVNAARRHQRRHHRSRSKRCCKNSTQFEIVKNVGFRGYRRRDFAWSLQDLRAALKSGTVIKSNHVLAYQGVCVKHHRKKTFHQDRCLASWKMSQALAVRGVSVPRALGYYVESDRCFFLAEYLADTVHLNDYLSAIEDTKTKRRALKKLALWLKKCHDANVWQRDFKSSNILCRNSEYFMVDLDGVRIRRLSDRKKTVNLAQLNASVSNAITLKDRLRFYHYYSVDDRPTRRQRREVFQNVWDISKGKNTQIYDLDLEKL
ncbi:MAG: lipopolysaccharide kinase InaA family protein [Desulfobacterales bacterium]